MTRNFSPRPILLTVVAAVICTALPLLATRSAPASGSATGFQSDEALESSTGEGHFPSAQELRTSFDAGKIPGAYRPTDAELESLQDTLDTLNSIWSDLRSRQHDTMRRVALERIALGEVQPASNREFSPRAGLIGAHAAVVDGTAYRVDFLSGQEPEIDRLDQELRKVDGLGDAVILAWFE